MTVRSIFCLRPRDYIWGISSLRRLPLSLKGSLPDCSPSGTDEIRASIKLFYIIYTFLSLLHENVNKINFNVTFSLLFGI